MHKFTGWVAAVCAAAAMTFAAPAAQAQISQGSEARATASVNVRSGPSTGFRAVDTLQPNEVVTVQQCRSSWCYIQKAGPDGWVSSRYLAPLGGGGGGGTPVPPPSSGGGNFTGDAQATAALNVRSGPGTNFGVVDTLSRGERVQVGECRGSWCLIRSQDGTGWVSQNFLARPGQGGGGGGNSGGGASGPDIGFTISGPNFSFSIGTGADFGSRPVRPEDRGQACFFEDANFGGRSVCARPGDSYTELGSFNDRISSIRIQGDIEVQVCQDNNFRGRCALLTASQPALRGQNDDIISSFRVR